MIRNLLVDDLTRRAIILVVITGIFVIDVMTSVGMAVSLLYLFPLLLTNWLRGRREPLYFAALCSVLTLADLFFSPPGIPLQIALFNRTVGLGLLWALAVFMAGQRRATEDKASALAAREQAVAESTSSTLRLESIVMSAMDAIITVDEEQNVVLFNQAAEKMFHCPAGEAIGRPLAWFIPARFREAHHEHITMFGRSGSTSRQMGALGTITGLRADGKEFPIEASISQIGVDGKKYFTVILRDVTERKRAEQRFQIAIEASPTGMLKVDGQGTIQLVNRQIEEWFGYARQELLGRPIEMLVPERYRAGHAEHRTKFFAKPEVRQMGKGRELYGVRKDGTEFPIEIGLSPVKTEAGMGVLASVVDISERRRFEQQLRQTERLAEMGTLASGMAHEIGTPMNVIQGRAEQLMRRTQEETTKKGLETIVAQVERITKIMNQLLTFARRKPSERRRINLGQTLDDCLEVLQERLRRMRVRVESRYETLLHPVHVHADPDQMSQVFLNLFINAIHAMPDGGTLRISLERVDGHARAVIADTGHGISKEDLPKIFHPFFTTKEAGQGTGLGLTVVHGIIQEHGGTITVESEPGTGTTFTVTLPAAKSI